VVDVLGLRTGEAQVLPPALLGHAGHRAVAHGTCGVGGEGGEGDLAEMVGSGSSSKCTNDICGWL